MRKDENASISVKKILIIALIFIFFLGISVLARNVELKNIKIKFANNHEITVLTSKSKVSEILDENHIVLASDEKVYPDLEEEITETKTIIITSIETEIVEKAEKEETQDITEITKNYENITEEIVVVQESIPYKTITKDVSNSSKSAVDKVIQQGKNGIREVTYKVKYKDDVEIERTEISSEVIQEPVNKIVQKQNVSSRSSSRSSGTSGKSGLYKVTAYCACISCCGKTNGITASGTKAKANHTIAAPSTFAFGTEVVINGKTYTVEDRGGAIQGNRIDIYMNSHKEALAWGVRYLEVEVK